jgi:hypothetical protein
MRTEINYLQMSLQTTNLLTIGLLSAVTSNLSLPILHFSATRCLLLMLMNFWIFGLHLFQHGGHPPFTDHNGMNKKIDAIPHRDIQWQSFMTLYEGAVKEPGLAPGPIDEISIAILYSFNNCNSIIKI